MSPHVAPVKDSNFYTEVIKSEKPVLVCFYADGDRCTTTLSLVDKLANERKDTLKVVKLDIATNDQTAEKYFITDAPSLYMFRESKVFGQKIGDLTETSLNKWIDQNLSKPVSAGLDIEKEIVLQQIKDIKNDKDLVSKVITGTTYAGTALLVACATGGVVLAATASTYLMTSLGVIATATNLLYADALHKLASHGSELLDDITEKLPDILSKDKKTVEEETRVLGKKYGGSFLSSVMANPALKLAFCAINISAGFAIWPVVGTVATIASVCMIVTGGLGAIKSLGYLKPRAQNKINVSDLRKKMLQESLKQEHARAPTPSVNLEEKSAKVDFDPVTNKKTSDAVLGAEPVVQKDTTSKPSNKP